MQGEEQRVVLKNNKVELTLNSKGATVERAVVKNYVGHDINVKDGSKDRKDVTLFEGKDQSLKFMLAAKEANINTADLYFTPSAQTDSTVTFTASAGAGRSLSLKYTLGRDYLLHMQLSVEGMGGLFAPDMKTLDIDWQDRVKQQERGFTFENRYATLTYHETAGGTDYLSETSERWTNPARSPSTGWRSRTNSSRL